MTPISCNQESRREGGGDEEGFPAPKSCRVLLGIRGKWEKAGVVVWVQSMIHHSHGMLALSPDSHACTPARLDSTKLCLGTCYTGRLALYLAVFTSSVASPVLS